MTTYKKMSEDTHVHRVANALRPGTEPREGSSIEIVA